MARWYKEAARFSCGQHPTLLPSWRYYVHVCSFTFVFASVDEIPQYIEHYQTKILPSSRIRGYRVGSQYGDHWEVQRWHERLPLRLREEGKRQEVIRALTEALADFRKQDAKRTRR